MKQHITEEQWNEIAEKQKDILLEWLKEKKYGVVDTQKMKNVYGDIEQELNIGQMIEFLDDGSLEFKDRDAKVIVWEWNKELCDELWERVKEILNK